MAKEFRQKRLVGIDYVFNFGKYAGFSYQEIVWGKPDYIKFLLHKKIVKLTEEAKNELYHVEFKDRMKSSAQFNDELDLESLMEASISNIDSYIKLSNIGSKY